MSEQTITDDLCGTLTVEKIVYYYQGTKSESVNIFGKKYKLNITFNLEQNDGGNLIVPDVQKEIYKVYKSILDQEKDGISKALIEHTEAVGWYQIYDEAMEEESEDGDGWVDLLESNHTLEETLEPDTILFTKDKWGILCETDCDEEHGLAVTFNNKNSKDIQIAQQGSSGLF